jgi:hypothetical protein
MGAVFRIPHCHKSRGTWQSRPNIREEPPDGLTGAQAYLRRSRALLSSKMPFDYASPVEPLRPEGDRMNDRGKLKRWAALFVLVLALIVEGTQGTHAGCALNSVDGRIKRVVYITFDNLHLRRDTPNVPSDLEQMPALLNFMLDNGTISGNHHTALLSHTATGILTALTGVYGDRMGMPVSTSYGYFRPDGSVGFSSSFLYWTALGGDGKPQMLAENGKTAPAPWVPFTRAGCDVGSFGVPNIEMERLPDDVTTFFGAGSKEDQEVRAALALPDSPPNQPARQKPATDFLGIAIHCARGSLLCGNGNSRADLLPDEPGGYEGYRVLLGNAYVRPVVSPAGPVKDLDGKPITDAYGQAGLPGFNPTATQSLGYAAAMLEAGVPVVYAYIADAHERNPVPLDPKTNKPRANRAFGPGETEYVAQLKAYDRAFARFFARLEKAHITKDNTLFLIVPDENDHFVGSKPRPAGCDGVTVPCTYEQAAEIGAQLNRLLLTQRRNATPFAMHSDSAPTVYVIGNPEPTAAVTRNLEHDLDALVASNPITGKVDKLSAFLADRAMMALLHMVTASPARTPTLTMFGNINYFFFNAANNTKCTNPPPCIEVPRPPAPTFAWNHGGVQRAITRTWLGMVGPGVKHQGRDDTVFSDHADVRPTMMALLGLQDSYVHDGRILVEKLETNALPRPLALPRAEYVELAEAYKQLNAPLGGVGVNSLATATWAIIRGDRAYRRYLKAIAKFTAARDSLAAEMKTVLNSSVVSSHQGTVSIEVPPLVERARGMTLDVKKWAAQ